MSLSSPPECQDDALWRALRALISGGGAKIAPSEALAQRALLGEVEALAEKAMPELSPWLREAIARRREEAILIAFAEARVLELMESAGVQRWVALKGSSSAYTLYSEPSHRVRRDVDLLVSRQDMGRLCEAARESGWQDLTKPTHLAGSEEEPYERELMIPIGGHRIACDLHQRLLRWREFPIACDAILERSITTPSGWRVCDEVDLLIHTALHAANTAFQVPLRALFDVHLLVSSGRLDWKRVKEQAHQWHAGRCLWLTLHIVHQWFKSPLPEGIMSELSPPPHYARRLVRAFSGEGERAHSLKAQGRLGRGLNRCLLREDRKDAAKYIWQTLTREMGLALMKRRGLN